MVVYKVEADYAPRRRGIRTEPGTNSIEYYFSDRELAKQVAIDYVLESERHDNVEWIPTSETTYELAREGSDEPIQNIHAKIVEVELSEEYPDLWSADDRRDALQEANA